jgi:pyrroline-5-carboxylate reductase
MLTAGFIGGGRITRILAGGWARTGSLPARVLVHDPDRRALDALAADVPGVEFVPAAAAARADFLFLALHPPAMLAAVAAAKPTLGPNTVLVSLAPKITIAALQQAAGTSRIVRMIPNAPSMIGRRYNPVAYGAGVDARSRMLLSGLFEPWGLSPEVPEPHLEAYAILTGMGPTYFGYQWQTLRELSVELGFPETEAHAAMRSMVEGALATLLDAGLTPAATMDLIPVKPLADVERTVIDAYRAALPALYAKIRPAVESLT